MKLKLCLLILPALVLSACNNDDNSASSFNSVAIVATRAPDYSSGALSAVGTSAPFTAQNNINPTTSDLAVKADGDHFFMIRRFGANQISRYNAATPTVATYTYSTNDSGESNSNPYDIIVASPTKAYLIRYGSSTVWIVNPSATSEANFKIGSIDLSQYDADGIPEMSAGLIKNGKLYVAMQRLVNAAATQDGYVAVIDIATDTEIATGGAHDGSSLKGIQLPVRDPVRLVSVPNSDAIIAVADGGYDGSFNQQYNGGIVSIIPTGYTTTLLINDGDDTTHLYGSLTDVALATNDRGYFIGSAGFFGPQTLYRFNPGSAAAPVPVAAYQGLSLGSIAVDPNGQLWVGLTGDAAPGLSVLGFSGGAETVVKALINTELTPMNIDFVTAPNN